MEGLTTREIIINIQSELNSLISRQKKTRFYMFLGGIGMPLLITILGISDSTTRVATSSTAGLGIIGLTTILILIGIHWIGQSELRALQGIKKLVEKTEDILTKQQNIQEILSLSEQIYKALTDKSIFTEYIRIDHAYSSIGSDINQLEQRLSIWQDIVSLYMIILHNLQIDMLSELEQKKQELNTSMLGLQQLNKSNNGVQKASELQQARLDKQIGQFEELQRVLVKV